MKVTSGSIVKDAVKNNLISEKNIKLLFKRMNGGEKIDLAEIWDNPVSLTPEQNEKGRAYLLNLWKTPTGAERKNNPFGYREQDILENFVGFELAGYYDAGNYNRPFYVPLYNVNSKDNGFQYYVAGGQIQIIG